MCFVPSFSMIKGDKSIDAYLLIYNCLFWWEPIITVASILCLGTIGLRALVGCTQAPSAPNGGTPNNNPVATNPTEANPSNGPGAIVTLQTLGDTIQAIPQN